MGMNGEVVVVTGAGGPAGLAVTERLTAAGATVVAADVKPVEWSDPRVEPAVVDLLDAAATRRWADEIAARHGRVDGLIHLVGGWRGGKSFADNDPADWALLEGLLVRTLQHTTLALHDRLRRSATGRCAIVSQPSARRPTQGGAAYAAAKAAAEAWTLALADSFKGTDAAAAVLVVKALLTDEMRAAKPDAPFTGFTHVHDLARAVIALWDRPAAELNGTHVDLTQA